MTKRLLACSDGPSHAERAHPGQFSYLPFSTCSAGKVMWRPLGSQVRGSQVWGGGFAENADSRVPWWLTAESKHCFSHPRPPLAKGLCGEPRLLRVVCHYKTQAKSHHKQLSGSAQSSVVLHICCSSILITVGHLGRFGILLVTWKIVWFSFFLSMVLKCNPVCSYSIQVYQYNGAGKEVSSVSLRPEASVV